MTSSATYDQILIEVSRYTSFYKKINLNLLSALTIFYETSRIWPFSFLATMYKRVFVTYIINIQTFIQVKVNILFSYWLMKLLTWKVNMTEQSLISERHLILNSFLPKLILWLISHFRKYFTINFPVVNFLWHWRHT